MTIDLSGLPLRITVPAGSRGEFALPSYSGSGNQWSARCVSGEDVARVWVELGEVPPLPPTPGDGIAEPPPLMLVPERAVVLGLAPGEADWQLQLARSFGTSNPAAVHRLHVTVTATDD